MLQIKKSIVMLFSTKKASINTSQDQATVAESRVALEATVASEHPAAATLATETPRPRPNKTIKVWVGVQLPDGPRDLWARERSVLTDPDEGGKYAVVLNRGVLRSTRAIPEQVRHRHQGRYAPSRQMDVRLIHHAPTEGSPDGAWWIRPGWVNVSTASGPFDEEIQDAINAGGTWAGAAYPRRGAGHLVSDTQLCVSGSPNWGESLIDAARREIKEELGIEVDLTAAEVPPRRRGHITHHLFWAVARPVTLPLPVDP